MVVADDLGQLRRVPADHRLDELVLVLGVGDEHPHEGAQPLAVGRERFLVAGVDVAGGVGDAEELVPDALVDVLVAVEDDDIEVGGLDGEWREDGGDGHGCSFRPGAPHGSFGTGGMRFRTIMRNARRRRS